MYDWIWSQLSVNAVPFTSDFELKPWWFMTSRNFQGISSECLSPECRDYTKDNQLKPYQDRTSGTRRASRASVTDGELEEWEPGRARATLPSESGLRSPLTPRACLSTSPCLSGSESSKRERHGDTSYRLGVGLEDAYILVSVAENSSKQRVQAKLHEKLEKCSDRKV